MNKIFRIVFIVIGSLSLVLAVGFCLELPWATSLWPWHDMSLIYTFLGSITAAAALSLLWIGFSGELSAIVGGSINLAVFYGGLTISLIMLSQQMGGRRLMIGALACMGGMLLSVGILLFSRRYTFQRYQPMPLLVRISFCLFIALLASVGGAVLLHIPNVFAWEIGPTCSALIGSFFLGASCYFIYGLLRPNWYNACGQLWAFLAYDLVLIGPFLQRFATVSPERLPSLIINTLVLVYSGGLAIYYLLVNKETRTWRMQEKASQSSAYCEGPSLQSVSRP